MSDKTRLSIGDEYEILDILGQGGMARVFKARQRYLDRVVALKVLPPRFLADDDARARFEREARAGALLEHDHIVTTYDFGIHKEQPYLAVAFIEGQNLTERIRRMRRLSPEESVSLIAPIAEALAFAHRKGVIHRDIKSSNIMIRAEDQRPILIDFGIAQAASTQQLTQKGTMLGTPSYMSPEQASAQEIDFRSDLYSLGVVLYECLTGTLPFQSPNTEVLLTNIKYEPHPPLQRHAPDVPAWLSAVVDRCLAKRPEDRFANGDALSWALRAGPSEETIALPASKPRAGTDRRPSRADAPSAPRQDPASPEARPAKSKFWLAGLAVGILALGGIGYGAGWFDGFLGQDINPPEQPDSLAAALADSLAQDSTAALALRDSTSLLPTNTRANNTVRRSRQTTTQQQQDTGPTLETLLTEARTAFDAGGYDEARTLLETAAERGSSTASLRLGRMYETGQGTRKNEQEAARWYRQAAEGGLAEAQFYLSSMYRDGRGVERNLDEAVLWCRRAAEGGLAEAQFILGRMYFRGQGVTRNDEEAVNWYRKAAAQGHQQAQGALDRLMSNN